MADSLNLQSFYAISVMNCLIRLPIRLVINVSECSYIRKKVSIVEFYSHSSFNNLQQFRMNSVAIAGNNVNAQRK